MNILLKTTSIVVLSSVLSACSYSSYRPIVDNRNQDLSNYEQDLRECQQLSKQVSPGRDTAVSAGLGALFGTAIGLVAGGSGHSIRSGAAIGAISGGSGGAFSSNNEQHRVINNCLRGRGYRILN